MDILRFSFDNYYIISVSMNVFVLVILGLLIVCMSFFIKKHIGKAKKRSIDIDEIKLGIGQSSVLIKYDRKDREIAYKLWVELNTRKIGLEFDEENDVIMEVYDSWYECFGITRELLKEIPVSRINYSLQLIELIMDILNKGLRPHLTKWQADFRHWYELEKEKQPDISPQELQRRYQDYAKLVNDLIRTNQYMTEYKNLLKSIALDT